MKIVDGNKIAENILIRCKSKVDNLGLKPKLAIIMVGNNPASLTYIEKKHLAGEKVGVGVKIYKYDTATEDEILKLISALNNDASVNGIIVQLPLTTGINEYDVCSAISANKDVDGLSPFNMGELWLNSKPRLVPATVKAVGYTLEYISEQENIEYEKYIEGKTVLIINKSQIIGKPLSGFLANLNATVILAHSKTQELDKLISLADIIVSGTGNENFLSTQKFKDGVVLIDVGFNKTDKRIYGDVDKSMNNSKISWLTPVPGGIGPIGVACLIENVIGG